MNTDLLLEMLTYRRPADSTSEAKWITQYIDTVPGIQADSAGNRYIRLGDSATMFTAHTDTVHNGPGRQKVFLDAARNEVFIGGKGANNCLGADDCAGVFIMLEMIQAAVPGLYVFTRAEEIGGLGSAHIVAEWQSGSTDLLTGIERCVSLDRKGHGSVITHQAYGQGCSHQFSAALAKGLGPEWMEDDTGVFTDSAQFIGVIPECTNLSVGYLNEHSKRERLSLDVVARCIRQFTAMQWEALPTVGVDQTYDTVYSGEIFGPNTTRGEIWDALDKNPARVVEWIYDMLGDEYGYGYGYKNKYT